jgi:hypothetical protein
MDEACSSCTQRRVNERVIMVGTVPCTLEPGGQHPANTDIAIGREPGYQHKKALVNVSSRERYYRAWIYTALCTYREIQSRTQLGGGAR